MRVFVAYMAAFLTLLLLWQGAAMLFGEYVLPGVVPTMIFFVSSLGTVEFWAHVGASFSRIGPGLAIAFCVGFPSGALLGTRKAVDRFVSPFVFLTYPIPKIVFLPVLLTALGLGDAPRITLVALTAGYQVLVITRGSALGLDRKYMDSFITLGGTSCELMRHVVVPAVLPDALTALRVACGTAVAVLFMTESFATTEGLGFLIMDAWGRGDLHEMFSGILGMSLMGVLLYEGCNMLERKLCPWMEPATD